MKKISMILFAAIIAISFTACGGSKGEDKTGTDQVEIKTETVESGDAAGSGSADEFLKKYEKFMNDMLPLIEKVGTGDASAVAEYTKLAQDAQTFAQDAAKYVPNFTADQMKKYEEITKKYTDAVTKMSGQ